MLFFESESFFKSDLFIHSIRKKSIFINVVKRCRNFCAQFPGYLLEFLTNQNFWGVLAPPDPTSLIGTTYHQL